MDNTTKEPNSESLPTGVFDLPGEPAIIINGVPDISPIDSSVAISSTVSAAESLGNKTQDTELLTDIVFGEWLEGREVKKLFGDQYYTGTVAQFDRETGWYRVVYEDGDFEDLDWNELQDVILPLDITVPLRSLALKIIKKNHNMIQKSGKSVIQSKTVKAKIISKQGIEYGGS